MRSSTLQEGQQSWSNKVKRVGYWQNNIQDGKFTSAWESIIIIFFRHINVWHGPQIICQYILPAPPLKCFIWTSTPIFYIEKSREIPEKSREIQGKSGKSENLIRGVCTY
jgi:hypothetical protein